MNGKRRQNFDGELQIRSFSVQPRAQQSPPLPLITTHDARRRITMQAARVEDRQITLIKLKQKIGKKKMGGEECDVSHHRMRLHDTLIKLKAQCPHFPNPDC